MTKMTILAAGVFAAGLASAEIASANVVGYSSSSFSANKNFIVGAQFADCTSANDEISFDSLVTPTRAGAWGDGEDDTMGNAPKLMIWTGTGYEYFYYISDATYDEDRDYESVGYDCWADRDGIILNDADKTSLGNGCWIRMQDTNGGLTFKGQVDDTDTYSIPVEANKNKIVANPYPISLDYAKLAVADGIIAGAWGDGEDDTMGDAAKLMVWTGSGYEYYYYISDATYDEDRDYEAVGYNCWADRDGIILTSSDQIDVGVGFWVRSPKAGSLVFSK